jgi:hypothetical protein
MSSPEVRAAVRGRLADVLERDPRGEAAAALWWVANMLWERGDPPLPEPPLGGREDAA